MRHSLTRNAEHVSDMTCFSLLAKNIDTNLNVNKTSYIVIFYINDNLNR